MAEGWEETYWKWEVRSKMKEYAKGCSYIEVGGTKMKFFSQGHNYPHYQKINNHHNTHKMLEFFIYTFIPTFLIYFNIVPCMYTNMCQSNSNPKIFMGITSPLASLLLGGGFLSKVFYSSFISLELIDLRALVISMFWSCVGCFLPWLFGFKSAMDRMDACKSVKVNQEDENVIDTGKVNNNKKPNHFDLCLEGMSWNETSFNIGAFQ